MKTSFEDMVEKAAYFIVELRTYDPQKDRGWDATFSLWDRYPGEKGAEIIFDETAVSVGQALRWVEQALNARVKVCPLNYGDFHFFMDYAMRGFAARNILRAAFTELTT